VLRSAKTYADAIGAFSWDIPARYNIGVDVIDKHIGTGHGDRLALVHELESGAIERFSFADIARKSNSLANLLVAQGIRPGDRVAILLPQHPQTAISHVAIYKAGMIAVPLFTLFGPDALEYRLADSGARAPITDVGLDPTFVSPAAKSPPSAKACLHHPQSPSKRLPAIRV
jgi:acetyl-CoA synthetase